MAFFMHGFLAFPSTRANRKFQILNFRLLPLGCRTISVTLYNSNQEFNYEGLYAIILGDIDGYYKLFNSLIVSEKDKYGYQNKNGTWF